VEVLPLSGQNFYMDFLFFSLKKGFNYIEKYNSISCLDTVYPYAFQVGGSNISGFFVFKNQEVTMENYHQNYPP